MTRLLQSVVSFGSSAGCGQGVMCALATVLALQSAAPSWNAVPVDMEDPGAPVQNTLADEKVAVEALLAQRSNLSSEQRHRVARAIVEESHQAKFDPVFVLAVMGVESELNRDAVSNKGAKGLMQLRDSTALYLAEKEKLGLGLGDIGDPALNVRVGVRYLNRLYKSFGDLSLALVAYNAGPHRVSGLVKHGRPVPARFMSYPRKVNAHYQRLLVQLDDGSLRVAHPLHLRVAAR